MSSAAKRLIVNADDFGRTPGVNRGIIVAHRQSIVTSASLMVNQPAAAEAAALARENPGLGVGLHLALTGGPSALPAERIPSLLGPSGSLQAKPEGLGAADPAEVLAEARAQLRRFREIAGQMPTHFDSHHHVHRLPAVLEAVVTLAWETGLPVRSASPEVAETLRREGIPTTDHFLDGFYGEAATVESLVRILGDLPLGTTELMCHPGVVDDALRVGSSYVEHRARELEALTHRETRQVIQAAGIRLIHFGQL